MTVLPEIQTGDLSFQNDFFLIPASLFHIGYEKALVLTRIQYWIRVSGHEVDGEEGLWIYNSIKKWHEQFSCFSQYKIKKIISSLEKDGLLISKKVNAKKYNHTKWYTIDFDKLSSTVKPGFKKICSKSANGSVEKRPIYNSIQKNNYTNRSSSTHIEEEPNIKNIKERTKKELTKNDTEPFPPCKTSTAEKNHQEDTAQQMVEVWNEEFIYSLSPIKGYRNDKITKELYELYTETFENNIELWRIYARHVNSSKFLMGEKETKKGFKAVFRWLIRKDVVKEILDGGYGVGDRELDIHRIDTNVQHKKKEVIQKVSVKAIDLLKRMVLEDEEKREFERYVRNKRYLEDGDMYGMKCVFKDTLCSERALREREESALYMYNYENYITRKHLGLDLRGLEEKVRKSLDITGEGGLGELQKLCDIEKKLNGVGYKHYGEPGMLLEGLLLSGLGAFMNEGGYSRG